MKRFLKYIIILTFLAFNVITFTKSSREEFNSTSGDSIVNNPAENNTNMKELLDKYKVDKYKETDSKNKVNSLLRVQNISSKETDKLNKEGVKVNNESDVPKQDIVNKSIDIATDTQNTGFSSIFFDSTSEYLKVPLIVQSLKLAAYTFIINGITRLTGVMGAKVSVFMGIFIVMLATLQLVWNGLQYYVSITKQGQEVNIVGYLSQQVPYIVRVGIISALLLTNFYWYFYSVICKNLFILLGGIFGGHAGINYTTIITQLIKIMWIPILLILKSLVLAITIIPIFTGTFWFCLILGFGLGGLVSRAVTEFVIIVIEYMVVGIFSIIVIPLALLDFTRSYGSKIIGAMLAAGINLVVGTALISFITRNANALDISFWALMFKPATAYFNLMLLFLFITLLSKTKTIGNFIIKGQGNTVKGAELVTEGLMVAFEGISSIVTIVSLATGIGSIVSAAQAAAAQAAQEAAKVATKEAAKMAIKEGATQAGKEGAKQVAQEGVKQGVNSATKEAVQKATKKATLQELKQQLKKASSRRMTTQFVGKSLAQVQANNGEGIVGLAKNFASMYIKRAAMQGIDTGSTVGDMAAKTGVEAADKVGNDVIDNI